MSTQHFTVAIKIPTGASVLCRQNSTLHRKPVNTKWSPNFTTQTPMWTGNPCPCMTCKLSPHKPHSTQTTGLTAMTSPAIQLTMIQVSFEEWSMSSVHQRWHNAESGKPNSTQRRLHIVSWRPCSSATNQAQVSVHTQPSSVVQLLHLGRLPSLQSTVTVNTSVHIASALSHPQWQSSVPAK